MRRKVGDIVFNKDYKVITDSSRKNVNGPGSVFQIDSTPADIELISELDGSTLTGSPTLYLVTDVFSGMIVGFYASYENPSYLTAMLALLNSFENKKEFCARYGVDLEEEDWPSNHLPASIIADRGELLGNQAENLVAEFGITVANAVAYRPDMKGLVERHFQTVHKNLKTLHSNIGLKGQRHGERGVRNARLDACLTLNKYIKIIISEIISYNRSTFLKAYPQSTAMKMEGIKPVPAILWQWGISNRSGVLKKLNNKNSLLRLLPKKEVSLTKRGIKFQNNYYNLVDERPELVNSIKQLQISGQSRGRKIEISYHPWNSSQIYVNYNGTHVLFSISQSRNPVEKNSSIWDVEQYNQSLILQKYQHDQESMQKKVESIQDINEIIKAAKQVPKTKLRTSNIKNIRRNKDLEKTLYRKKADESVKEESIEVEKESIETSGSSREYKFPSFLDDVEELLND